MQKISRISAIILTSIIGISLGVLRPILQQTTTYATSTTASSTKTMIGKSYIDKWIKDNDPTMKIMKYGEKDGYGVYTVGQKDICLNHIGGALINNCKNIITTKGGIIRTHTKKDEGLGHFYRFTKDGVLFYFLDAARHDPACSARISYDFTYYNIKSKKTISTILTETYLGLYPDQDNNCNTKVGGKDRKLTSSTLEFYDNSKGFFTNKLDIKAKTTEEGFYKILDLEKKGKLYSLFSDYNIGFSFKYPNNRKITIDHSSDTQRIQNFNYPDDGHELSAGDFIIEVFYQDGLKICGDEMSSITSRYTVNGTKVVRGYGSMGDIPGIIHKICFNKRGKTIYISYIENGNIYADSILKSLKIN